MQKLKKVKEKKYLNNIKSETERMDNLVKKLLELSRTEKIHNNDLSIENLSKIVENRSLTFESLAFEQDINIESEITKDILYKCDPEQIKEVVNILVDNAIKHSYKDTTIKVNLNKDKNNINIEILNTGDPIKEGDEEKAYVSDFSKAEEIVNKNNQNEKIEASGKKQEKKQ